MRVKFSKGQQRKFLKKVLVRTDCPSLKELAVRLNIPYSTLKNYFVEQRLIPDVLFYNLCSVAKIDSGNLNVKFLQDNWGSSIGGKGKRSKI